MVEVVVAVFMALMGVGIALIWTLDIRAGRGYVTTGGLRVARDPDNGNRMALHWLAEYGTAVGLLVGAGALVADMPFAETVAMAALGALAYTSVNSLAWVLASPTRRAYAVPMVVGLIGSAVSLALLASRL